MINKLSFMSGKVAIPILGILSMGGSSSGAEAWYPSFAMGQAIGVLYRPFEIGHLQSF